MKKFHIFLLMMLACNAYAATETINWYVDGSVYDTTTCQSGGNVNLPTQPTKRGHTFAGWVVALYDMSTLDYTTDGTNYTYNASAYTWATIFDYGLVSGTALCSVTPGSWATAGTPDESTSGGQHCWCKATGYTPSGSNVVYEPTSNLAWVFLYTYGTASDCADNCANDCGYNVRSYSVFRSGLFGAQ